MTMNIMISLNSAYTRPAQVMLCSLCETHPGTEIEIFLLHTGLTDREIGELRRIVDGYAGKKLTAVLMDASLLKDVPVSAQFTPETYYRIIAPLFLPESVDRILHLDVDMIVQKNLETLYSTDITGHPFAVCEDAVAVINSKAEECRARCGLSKESRYFNSGVMLFNLEFLRGSDFVNKTVGYINDNRERLVYPDQDALNALYSDESAYVPWDLYNCPPELYFIDRRELEENDMVRFVPHHELAEAVKAAAVQEQAGRENAAAGQEKAACNPFLNYMDISAQIRDNACIIHYMGRSKPWHDGRERSSTYRLFDEPYRRYDELIKSMI